MDSDVWDGFNGFAGKKVFFLLNAGSQSHTRFLLFSKSVNYDKSVLDTAAASFVSFVFVQYISLQIIFSAFLWLCAQNSIGLYVCNVTYVKIKIAE